MRARKARTRGGARPGAGRPPTLKDGTRILVYVDGAVARALRGLARRNGKALSQYARDILTQHVKRTRRG